MDKAAEPTEAQKKAGNYKKGHIRYSGMDISIENPAGSKRRGKSPEGKEWSSHMYHHYGYIRRTLGRDKDQIDVFIKPGTKSTEKVYIVNQVNKDGSFDEHKCMLGFTTKIAAERAYLMNYEKGWDGAGSVVEMPIESFKKWVYSSRKMKPARTKDIGMEKKSNYTKALEDVYNFAFNNELEKTGGKFTSIAKRVWSPGGNISALRSSARTNLKQNIRKVQPDLTVAKGQLASAQNKASGIALRQKKQVGIINKNRNAGLIERMVGGRFGTQARRNARFERAGSSLGGLSAPMKHAKKNVRVAERVVTKQQKSAQPAIDKIKAGYKSEVTGINARNVGNIAARTAIVGTGALAANSAIRSRMQKRYY